MKKLRIALLPLAAWVLCSGFVCTGTQIHKVNVANADLSLAINKASVAVIQLAQNGTITTAEENAVLPKFYDASVLSNQINKCTISLSAGQTLPSCVSPLLLSVQSDMAAASLGIPAAKQSYIAPIVAGVTLIFAEFTQAAITSPSISGSATP